MKNGVVMTPQVYEQMASYTKVNEQTSHGGCFTSEVQYHYQ